MKKFLFLYGMVVVIFSVSSCSQNKEKNEELENKTEKSGLVNSEILINTDSIDKIRAMVESVAVSPIEIETSKLREKIKQKWSKIHFYTDNNIVVKIKTYPYPEVSKRTEEFYANESGLVLVVIEDNGDGKKGKTKDEIDKMYYFNKGAIIKEYNNQKEAEQTIKESDAEELLSEFNEYMKIYKELRK